MDPSRSLEEEEEGGREEETQGNKAADAKTR